MKKICYLFAIVFCLFGCSEQSTPNLRGKTFTLNNSNITLSFDIRESKFYGKALNNYFGNYKLDKNQITFELVGTTMMMGSPSEVEEETKYFNNLSKINFYHLENKQLILKGEYTELIYKEN